MFIVEHSRGALPWYRRQDQRARTRPPPCSLRHGYPSRWSYALSAPPPPWLGHPWSLGTVGGRKCIQDEWEQSRRCINEKKCCSISEALLLRQELSSIFLNSGIGFQENLQLCHTLINPIQQRLKTLDTIGNCQRPVFSLGRPDTSRRQRRRLPPLPLPLPWCPWNAPAKMYNFLIGCPLPKRKCLGAPAPSKTKHTGLTWCNSIMPKITNLWKFELD